MATISYAWGLQNEVDGLECAPSLDGFEMVVRTVHWQLTGTDGTHEGRAIGAVGLGLDPEGDFIAFADLTLDQVMGWVRDALGDDQVTAALESVADQIAAAQSRPIAQPAPWAVFD